MPTNQPDERPGSVSAVPYALFVPVLVIMAQSAWVQAAGGNFRLNGLLPAVANPIALCGMAVIALVSFFVIRPFVNRVVSRWTAFLSCVVGFTILIELLLPRLAD